MGPGGAGPDAVVLFVGWQQAEQFVAGVVGVSDDPIGLLPTLLGVDSSFLLVMCCVEPYG